MLNCCALPPVDCIVSCLMVTVRFQVQFCLRFAVRSGPKSWSVKCHIGQQWSIAEVSSSAQINRLKCLDDDIVSCFVYFQVNVDKVQLEDGKTIPASQYGENVEMVAVGELTSQEQEMVNKVKVCLGIICYKQ